MSLRELHSNCCLLCMKAYSARIEDIAAAGKLFAIEGYMVGNAWGHSIDVCPSCIRKQFIKIRKEQDTFLAEMEKHETNRRFERYYGPKKKTLTKCPICGKSEPDSRDPEECGGCGEDLVVIVDDPRQVRHRERRKKREKREKREKR